MSQKYEQLQDEIAQERKQFDEKMEKMLAESKYKSLEISTLSTNLENEKQKGQVLRDNIGQV